jgi:hypothetical protein
MAIPFTRIPAYPYYVYAVYANSRENLRRAEAGRHAPPEPQSPGPVWTPSGRLGAATPAAELPDGRRPPVRQKAFQQRQR